MTLLPALLLSAAACAAPADLPETSALAQFTHGGSAGRPVAPSLAPSHDGAGRLLAHRPAPALPAADSLARAFQGGVSWTAFLEDVEPRRDLWHTHWAEWEVAPDLLARARATGGPWRILAISDAACSDSVNTLPILARLATLLDDAEFRLLDNEAGRPWMEAHRSPDGRASTPTVLLLDDTLRLRGCWVEQPAGMAAFWLPAVAAGTMRQELDRKMAWYAEDAGRSTLEEFVEVLEAAARGGILCPGVPPTE